MVKLKYLKIQRFRNVAQGTHLEFADGFNILLGKNGSGKTTLLRLLEAVTASSFSEFKDEPFDVEYQWADLGSEVTVHVQNVKREQAAADVAPLGRERVPPPEYVSRLRVTVALEAGAPPTIVETSEGRTTIRSGETTREHDAPMLMTGTAGGSFLLHIANTFDRTDIRGRALHWTLAFLDAPRFDESLGYYTSMKTARFYIVGPDHKAPKAVDFAVSWLDAHPKAKTPLGTTLTFPEADAPFLVTFLRALGDGRHAELQLSIASKDAEGPGVYSGLRMWLTKQDGSAHSDELLSYGQKRLLSFLYYLAVSEDIVIADELVNGLHHDWIALCVNEIGERQAFLTSQNPLLMDYLAFDSVEEVRKAFVLCQVKYDGTSERLEWKNMIETEAKGVFDAAEVGIESMSTILRNDGLW